MSKISSSKSSRVVVRRKLVLLACSLVVGLGCIASTGDLAGQDFMPETFERERFVEYERQLNAILKTRRDEEKMFVALVVEQVRLGELPSKLVSTSFQWVRKKRPDTNYPFIYFERVLRLQAKSIKLEEKVPPFDFSIYKSAGQQTGGQNGTAGRRTATRRGSFVTPGTRRN